MVQENMFRKAAQKDIERVTEIYQEIHTEEEQGRTTIGWNRAIYPTKKTAEDAVQEGDLFVEVDDAGLIVAAARINQEQVSEYADAAWEYDVSDNEVMVLHTLVVSPSCGGHGHGSKFIAFYEKYALECGCHYLRIDTNEKNKNARALYHKLGYTEVGIVPCTFQGLEDVQLVCLEKKI